MTASVPPAEPLRVLLVGAESAGVQVLKGLMQTPHRIVAVLADEPRAPIGEGLAGAAERHGLEVLAAREVRDPAFAGWIAERGVDLLLNVHSLTIAADAVVEAPHIGSFNLHPGPLPEYAGLDVYCWAVYHGERRHAVTLHWMDAGLDTGAVAYSSPFDLTESDTGLSVFEKCVRHGVPLVFALLEQAAADPSRIPRIPQVGARTLYRRGQIPHDGRIEWDRPAAEVHNLVRASDFGPFPSPWGRPETMLEDLPFLVVRTARTGEVCAEPAGTIGPPRDRGVLVATADEWLAVRGLLVQGRRVSPRDILTPGRRLGGAPTRGIASSPSE